MTHHYSTEENIVFCDTCHKTLGTVFRFSDTYAIADMAELVNYHELGEIHWRAA